MSNELVNKFNSEGIDGAEMYPYPNLAPGESMLLFVQRDQAGNDVTVYLLDPDAVSAYEDVLADLKPSQLARLQWLASRVVELSSKEPGVRMSGGIRLAKGGTPVVVASRPVPAFTETDFNSIKEDD